ncbi:MAG: PEP-CTERM sorting domain-containing protein [Rariglobus sp.]|nr:PEP-CTERM sorting domain-containing protein [Rariglobus sp.]
MKTTLTLGASLALLAFGATSASAVVLVDYAMTATVSPSNAVINVNPTVTAANVTAPALVNQSGSTASGSFVYNGGTDTVSSWATTFSSAATTYAGAFVANNYFTFSITPDAGYQLDLTSITFQVASGSSSASDRAFYLVTASSPSGFTSTSTVLSTDRTTTGGGAIPLQAATATNTIPKDYTVDLTSFTGITTTQYFRFYLQTPTINQALTFDDIIVNGTVSAVPEPATYASLAGVIALGFVACRRRKQKV